jgi:hypothetical protein
MLLWTHSWESCDYAINGERDGITYRLVSSDYAQFVRKDKIFCKMWKNYFDVEY